MATTEVPDELCLLFCVFACAGVVLGNVIRFLEDALGMGKNVIRLIFEG